MGFDGRRTAWAFSITSVSEDPRRVLPGIRHWGTFLSHNGEDAESALRFLKLPPIFPSSVFAA
jgi:hypothetical protein